MKSIISRLLELFFITIICASCSQLEELIGSNTDEYIFFAGTIGGGTRATDTSFESNDEISVFAFKNNGDFSSSQDKFYASNIKYSYNGDLFTALGDGISYAGDDAPITFRAVYPYTASAGARFGFTVKEDQSIGNNYTLSDLMLGYASPTTGLSPTMIFSHCLSSVTVDLSFEQVPAGTTKLQFTSLKTNVDVNLADSTFTANGNTGITVTAAENGTNSYKAVLPPQTITAGNPFVIIKTEDGHTYTWKPTTDLVLKSGKRKSLSLKVTASGEVIEASRTNHDQFTGAWKFIESTSPGKDINDLYLILHEDSTGYFYERGYKVDSLTWSVQKDQLILSYPPELEAPEGYKDYCNITNSTSTLLNLLIVRTGEVSYSATLEKYNKKIMTASYNENITPTEISFGGSYIPLTNNSTVSDYGICYSLINKNPTIADNILKGGQVNPNGIYHASLKNPESSTQYYFRSYVIVDGEAIYGDALQCTSSKSKNLKSIKSADNETIFTYTNNKLSSYFAHNENWTVTYLGNQVNIASSEAKESIQITLNSQGMASSATRLKDSVTTNLTFIYSNDDYLTEVKENNGSWKMSYQNGAINSFQYQLSNGSKESLNIYTHNNIINKAGIILPEDNWFDDTALEVAFYAKVLGKATAYLVEKINWGETGTENTNIVKYNFDSESYPTSITYEVGGVEKIFTLTYTE